MALQQCDGVLDGGGGARDGGGLAGGFGSGGGERTEPAAFDHSDYRTGVGGENGGAALSAGDCVA